jgi:hypothetical protein
VESSVVQYRGKKWINDFEGLNRAVEVLVIDGVLIMPNVRGRVCHLVTDEENAIVTGIRLNLVYCGTCPSHHGRLHPERGANGRKRESAGAAADSKLAIGDIVVHVALPWM